MPEERWCCQETFWVDAGVSGRVSSSAVAPSLRSAGLSTVVVGRLRVPAGAGGSTLGCAEVMPSPRPDRLGDGMELFGLGQGWAQSHKSVTPAVGDHADTELAVHLTTSASHAASGGARLRIS